MRAELISPGPGEWLIVEAARASFNKSYNQFTQEQNERLIMYLSKNGHWAPFRHPHLTVRCEAPIFVARQLAKHQIGFTWSEESRRYLSNEPKFYEPECWRLKPKDGIKQGSSTVPMERPDFVQGYCWYCGKRVDPILRWQGGGQPRKYCSEQCKNKMTNTYRNIYKNVFHNARARAIRENKHWDLDFDSFTFPRYCPYLGIELDYSIGKEKIQPNSPSFDRINPIRGYVEGNVEIVSHRANTMKNDASVEEQIKMAEAVLLKYKGYIPDYRHSYTGIIDKIIEMYRDLINAGYAPELARLILPVSMYTTWVWTGSLLAFSNMVRTRRKDHTQAETRAMVDLIEAQILPHYPLAWKCLQESEAY